jgi:beta-lactamase class A
MSINRRHTLALLSAGLSLPALASADALRKLEQESGGRLGVAVLDTGSGRVWGHRSEEAFALCSTFKLLLAGAVLQQVDQGKLKLDQWVPFNRADLVEHAPSTQPKVKGGGMSVVDLVEAIQRTSDNVAANLLMRLVDGPEGLTKWLRGLDDAVTRVDRWEPEMNRVPVGEVRDTTSPAAMAATTAKLLVGDVLSQESRARLIGWMQATQTGARRLRAGLPASWRAGNKTGTGLHPSMPDQVNDVAIAWPPKKAPWVVAAYYSAPDHAGTNLRTQDEAVLAAVGRIVAASAQA